MFGSLISRAQSSVDAVVSKALARVAVAVLFVVAAGFGVAALAIGLSDAFGPVVAYGVIAAAFAAIGGVLAAVWGKNGEADAATSVTALADSARASRGDGVRDTDWTDFADILKIAAPVALPVVLRMLVTKRPFILLALAAIGYILYQRSPAAGSRSDVAQVPAE